MTSRWQKFPLPLAMLQGQINWAMAGRNKERLEQLRLQLSETYGEDLKASIW
jgi:hypothetical protein